jgi:hypothetical protein
MNKVKSAILTPVENARDGIKNAIKKIKSFFDITLKFKGIKLPHIDISWDKKGVIAEAAKLLGVPGVPKFSVNWYKTGGIFDSPSVIGVGEAGTEAVVPIDKLQSYVSNAVASQNVEVVYTLQSILSAIKDMDSGMYNAVTSALDNRKILWNDRELGRLVSKHA